MATGKKSAIIYTEWISIFESLTDEEAGKLIKHCFRYINDLNPEPENRIIQLVFEPIKLSFKRDLKKYESICNRNGINGSKGGRPKNPTEPKKPNGLNGNPKKPKKADNDNDNDNEYKDSFLLWLKYKKENKQSYKSETSKKIALEKLNTLSGNDELKAMEIVKQSIANNWAGLFELKNNNATNQINGYKYLTKEEKQKNNLDFNREFIWWDGTTRMISTDDKGKYIFHIDKRIYL